jgi:[acyl-carrier-protein] S-malonyltransferase
VTSLCAIEALYAKSPESVKNCIAAAGFSVGEITALIFSGAISFEDGVKLVNGHFERE